MTDEGRITRTSVDSLVTDDEGRITRVSVDALVETDEARVTRTSVDALVDYPQARVTRVSVDALINLIPPDAGDFVGWGMPIGESAATPPTEDWTVYAETIGDGAATEIQVTHNLDTTDVIVAVYDLTVADPIEVVADVTIIDNNTVEVAFEVAPGTDERRVVVIG